MTSNRAGKEAVSGLRDYATNPRFANERATTRRIASRLAPKQTKVQRATFDKPQVAPQTV